MNSSPAFQYRYSFSTRKREDDAAPTEIFDLPFETSRPRCARNRQFEGPECGNTCVPEVIALNLTKPTFWVSGLF